ncbi:MAG TPA: slipin family protein [Firmicutes bacterium]|nr:slipin family protein [Bacillota bacterium]
MKTITINENQKGLLFQNGRFVKLLGTGKYYCFGGREIEVLAVEEPLYSSRASLDILLKKTEIARQTTVVEVADQQLALHFVDGKFCSALSKGKYAFWNGLQQHRFQLVDISSPLVSPEVPDYIFEMLPASFYTKVQVAEYQKARLYFNQKLERVLDAGTYYFWKNNIRIDVSFVDIRLTQMNITGQEILIRDKVSLRINFVCTYRITDYVKVLTEIDDYAEQLHVAVQLAMREYVGKQTLDEILENKEQISAYVLARCREKAAAFYLEIADGGVKDIILPGEIRDIMNTVLVAEKRAQANVITRREEVASTRSLLNTAKLMDENQTLLRLKEMEYIERICENVGNISLNGTGDILTQLSSLLKGRAS